MQIGDAARLIRKKSIVVSAALLAVCCQGLKGRIRDHAPDTPISFLPNNAFLSRRCVHCWGGMK